MGNVVFRVVISAYCLLVWINLHIICTHTIQSFENLFFDKFHCELIFLDLRLDYSKLTQKSGFKIFQGKLYILAAAIMFHLKFFCQFSPAADCKPKIMYSWIMMTKTELSPFRRKHISWDLLCIHVSLMKGQLIHLTALSVAMSVLYNFLFF